MNPSHRASFRQRSCDASIRFVCRASFGFYGASRSKPGQLGDTVWVPPGAFLPDSFLVSQTSFLKRRRTDENEAGAVLGLALAARGTAAIQYFHWDKPHHGIGERHGPDLTSRKVVWEASAGKSVNFVHETGAGVIFGNDEEEVVLLDKNNGKVIWRCRLEKSAEIKTLIADTEDGFFVSSGDQFYWLVSHEGKLLLRCNDSCSIPK
jgi:hypothetical protein